MYVFSPIGSHYGNAKISSKAHIRWRDQITRVQLGRADGGDGNWLVEHHHHDADVR